MQNKLTSMVAFVKEQMKPQYEVQSLIIHQREKERKLKNIESYANFLLQKPTLEMFVASVDGVRLKGKPLSPATDEEWDAWEKEMPIYEQAKSKVLFEGFEVCTRMEGINCLYNSELDLHLSYPFSEKTIEQLTKFNLTLTESAIKEIK